ncbi:MAG: aspartate aminotransferase family protein, partial [Gemmataceae bacterium]
MSFLPIEHDDEPLSNAVRARTLRVEPRSLRTFTPTQAVIVRSAGAWHFTPDGRKLLDFTSGVLVANLGHNPVRWTQRYLGYLGWPAVFPTGEEFFAAQPMTAYNAITTVETEASERLVQCLRGQPGGCRMEQVLWAASGSEAIQKALWAAMARESARPMILAT